MCLQGSRTDAVANGSNSAAEETQSLVLLAVTSDAETLLKHLGTDEYSGLSTAQAESCLEKYGYNELAKEDATPLWKLVLEQFEDTLVRILLAAAVVSFLLAFFEREEGEHSHYSIYQFVEPIVILVILILNAIVGVWQESNAEAALDALKRLQPDEARALRNGEMQTIPARFLVPGDIVELRVGDKVPADMRLMTIFSSTLRVDQAQLTGESESVEKHTEPLPTEEPTSYVIQNKTNMLFATTTVVNGMGRAVVVATGMETEIGHIQQAVEKAAEDDDSTPLQKKLDDFGDMLSKVIMVICILVWLINYKNFFDPIHGSVLKGCIYYFKIAVALAVAAIPEGLPTVITTCLALGTRKMAQKNAIVRRLPSVETLGCTSVICSDKTGTLTTGEMSCVKVELPGSQETECTELDVTGITYSPVGTVSPSPRFLAVGPAGAPQNGCPISMLSKICSLCNAASIEYDGNVAQYKRVGEPTEASLKVLVEKIGLPDGAAQKTLLDRRFVDPAETAQAVNNHWKNQYSVLATLEFSRDRKSMSVITKAIKNSSAANELLVKGSPEGILSRCTNILLASGKVVPLTKAGRDALESRVEVIAGQSLRCLALAYKTLSGELGTYDGRKNHPARIFLTAPTSTFHHIESELIFVGMVGMLDPPRAEVAPMIEICKTAGIRVIMITGDNKKTAESIAVKVGILPKSFNKQSSMTGMEFFNLPEERQASILEAANGTDGLVFSRTEPKHKQQLVKLLKSRGDVVAMTGDGVNDAPALKQADIGIAMGISGTEVAKEASDMVLADDNFATIVSAVQEGRSIYNNMQAFIRYLISSNIGEVAAIFLTATFGLPEGLIPVQLLWVNLVTDGPPATALGFNPPDADIMKKLPRRASDNLINRWTFFRYMVIGTYVGFACVGVFAYWYMFYQSSNDGHTLITWHQLTHWTECPNWTDFKVNDFDGLDMQTDPCKYFTDGKVTASTLSLSVLVTIEMLNALNALSEDGSLLTMPPWTNPYLLIAMVVSLGLHFVVLEVDSLAKTFQVTPLDWNEWLVVLGFSFPVILIDEVLKVIGRYISARALAARVQKTDAAKKND